MRHQARNLVAFAAAMLLLATAIVLGSDGRSADAASPPNITGMWASVYSTGANLNAGDCIIGIDETGGALTDTVPGECFNGAGTMVLNNGDLVGSISGATASGSIAFNNLGPGPATLNTVFSGTVEKSGTESSGTWSHEVGSGTFRGGMMAATATGSGVVVPLNYNGEITFSNVTSAGHTQAVFAPTASGTLPPNFQLVNFGGQPLFFHVLTTADYSGPVFVCAPYDDVDENDLVDGTNVPVGVLQIRHFDGGAWQNLTPVSWDDPNNRVCANAPHLSEFAIGATVPKEDFSIVFHSFRDGNHEIYRMLGDGTLNVRLTNNSASDRDPAWSQGNQIAFTSDRDGNDEIYVMKDDGSGQTRLTNNSASDSQAAWSPDGTKIAFVSQRDGNAEIYVMDATGLNQTRLTNNSAGESSPSWSPDGSKIAFVSNRDGNNEIYTMESTGVNQTRLTNNPASDTYPAWSPDEDQIAFTSDRDGNDEIYLMAALTGAGQTNLTNSPDEDWDPSWKANPKELIYTSLNRIFKMSANGSGQTPLTPAAQANVSGDWSRISGPANDFDADGCLDSREAHSKEGIGGRRNPQNFWDLFDVWTGPVTAFTKNKAVAATDFNAVLLRFGATGTATSVQDALTPPTSTTGYHAAYDRSAAPAGLHHKWDLSAPNGAIAATDFNAVLNQFGHNCN